MRFFECGLFVFFLTSCGTADQFLNSANKEVTVKEALTDVAGGLASFRNINSESGANNGLLVDEITLTLNVTTSRNIGNKLVIDTKDISAPALSGGKGGINLTSSRDGENTRSNTIVVKFKNKYTATLNTVGQKDVGNNTITTYSLPSTGMVFQCPPICLEQK